MADEIKQEKSGEANRALSTIFKFVLAIAFFVAAYYLFVIRHWWGGYTLRVIKGCAGPFLVLAGLITIAIAKE